MQLLLCRCGELVQHVLSAPADAHVVRLVDDISDEVSNTQSEEVCLCCSLTTASGYQDVSKTFRILSMLDSASVILHCNS